MHTARFETVCVSVAATRCQNWEGASSEQVWTGLKRLWWTPDVSSKGGRVSRSDLGGGGGYSEIQCIMGNGHIGPPLWTDMTENITFLQLRWGAVKMLYKLDVIEISRIDLVASYANTCLPWWHIHNNVFLNVGQKQGCIPVGCVPRVAVAATRCQYREVCLKGGGLPSPPPVNRHTSGKITFPCGR